jgi:hypothetical protein
MKNEKMTEIMAKAKKAMTHVGKVTIVLIAITVGFILGEMYHRIHESNVEKAPLDVKAIHKMKETSVAINERNELMIINRTSGTYDIYEDSIGKVIFRLYASQMVSNAQ